MSADSAEARLGTCSGRLGGKLRRAMRRWQMLPEGERVAVALSGGVDSMALLFLLARHAQASPAPTTLVGLHVRLDADGAAAPPLGDEVAAWCDGLGVAVHEVEARLDPAEEVPLSCFRCARIRRRTLLEAAEQHGCRRLALGHHADDVVETWLLGLFYNGQDSVLAPVRSYFDDAVVLIRPLVEIRKAELERLARLGRFPAARGACSRETHARRNRVRAVLGALGVDERRVRRQLFWAALRRLEDARDGEG